MRNKLSALLVFIGIVLLLGSEDPAMSLQALFIQGFIGLGCLGSGVYLIVKEEK